jgi:hypothetical protein
MTPEQLGQIYWMLVWFRRPYQGLIDDGAERAHPVYMIATDAIRVSERNQQIIDTIAALACPLTPTYSPSSSTTGPLEQGLIVPSHVAEGIAVGASANGSLKDASVNRLACLFRHWTWADEAMKHFERQLVDGWDYDEDPLADHPFGAFYHWCALLCGFTEAALERGLLSTLQLETLRPDLEASLPGLQACRQLLVVIPQSLEEHPRIVDLLRDSHTLGRLRRIHHTLGEALRKEQMSRELDWLLYEH